MTASNGNRMRRITAMAACVTGLAGVLGFSGVAGATDPAFIRDEEKAAQAYLTPAQIAKATAPASATKTATAAAVHGMLGERVVVLDVRPSSEFARMRVPNALNVVAPSALAGLLPADKAAPVVVYGADQDDPAAATLVRQASSEGYSNVIWMRGGFAEWVAARLPTASS